MNARRVLRNTGIGLAATAAAAAAGYAALVVLNRRQYGSVTTSPGSERDSMLDRFIPVPEVREHHSIEINAPADVVLATAKELELLKAPLVQAIIRVRELALGATPDPRPHPDGLLSQMLSIGWVVLAERAGREIILGAVTQPWETAPVFRSISAEQFAGFSEPGFVKIAWTLRADPVDQHHSIFHTETRVCTTDAEARQRFRSYWSFVAPGVELIRMAMLRPLARAAERRARGKAA